MKELGKADKAIQLVGQGGVGKVFRFVEHEREFAIKEVSNKLFRSFSKKRRKTAYATTRNGEKLRQRLI